MTKNLPRSSRGWLPFTETPPEDTVIHVYVETEEGEFWIVDGKWDARRHKLRLINYYGFDDIDVEIRCWRPRPSPASVRALNAWSPVDWYPDDRVQTD